MKKAAIMGFNTHQEQPFHVLAVDDSLLDRKLLERLLTLSSYNVTCVESGDKALEYLGLLHDHDLNHTPKTKVNLIMTDYSMPGMTGYDLLKRVKQSSWKDVPVVVMSAENEPSRIHMCLEEGAEDFLLKPVQLSDVKRLQPHLFKSAVTNSEINGDNSNADEDFDKTKSSDTICLL